jgi:putative chitinase
MIQTLIAAGINATQARLYAEPLKAAMALHAIDTPARQSAFIAQAMLETMRFTRMEENLFYTTPSRIAAVWPSRFKTAQAAEPYARNPQKLANLVYANRNGNGDEASGDGWRYRGRGIFQLTGKANYAAAARGLNRPYLTQPDLVAEPSDACLTAAWYWNSRNCSALADNGDMVGITRAINGPAMLHHEERVGYARELEKIIGGHYAHFA